MKLSEKIASIYSITFATNGEHICVRAALLVWIKYVVHNVCYSGLSAVESSSLSTEQSEMI